MLESPLFSLKFRSIAMLLTSFLRKTEEITLFFLSPYSRAKVSNNGNAHHFTLTKQQAERERDNVEE